MENQTRLHVTGSGDTPISRDEHDDLKKRVDQIEADRRFVLGAVWAIGVLAAFAFALAGTLIAVLK